MSGPDPAEIFRQEARELLESLEQGLLELDQGPQEAERVNAVFRALHTLKGSGAMFGYARLAAFLHDFEDAFDAVRQGRAEVGSELVSVALDAADHAADLIAAQAAGESGPDARGAALIAALQAARGAETRAEAGPGAGFGDAAAPVGGAAAGPRGWRVRFRLPPGALVDGTDPLLLLDDLRELGEARVAAVLADLPALDRLDPESLHLAWEATLVTDRPEREIREVFLFVEGAAEIEIAPLDPPEAAPAGLSADPTAAPNAAPNADAGAPCAEDQAGARDPAPSGAARTPAQTAARDRAGASTVRVPAARLDGLMDRVGELVIAQARLDRIAGQSEDPALKSVAEEMARLSAGLRDLTMGVRMMPIGALFGRFRRLTHDLSRDLGKEIVFETSGEETELDKTMIERLADPLVHLIRNAADHGLETPEARAAAGKPAAGRLRLSAEHVGAEVAITLSDDGRGLDAERIRARAVEADLLAEGEDPPEAALHRLIFEPGFSTAAQVTSLSGRGVGMDVVRRAVEGLRGAIDVASTPGEGAAVSLRLPLTLAIVDGLLVRVGAERYVIPLAAVEECVELPPGADRPGSGRSFLNLRGELTPFLRLRELFAATEPPDPHQKVVVVASGDLRVGLAVDQILGDTQTVIKQLSRLHSGLKTFSGATILGDGAVALILDVMNLVAFGQAQEARARAGMMGSAA